MARKFIRDTGEQVLSVRKGRPGSRLITVRLRDPLGDVRVVEVDESWYASMDIEFRGGDESEQPRAAR